MPGGFSIGKHCGSLHFLALRKGICILLCDSFAKIAHFCALAQLDDTDRRLNIGEVVLEPRFFYFVVPGTFGAIAPPGIPADTV